MEGMAAKLKRRGWCGCLRDDNEPPEITYCVVDGAGTLSLQAVTPSIPMPDEEELNAKFAELVVSTVYWRVSRLSRNRRITCGHERERPRKKDLIGLCNQLDLFVIIPFSDLGLTLE